MRSYLKVSTSALLAASLGVSGMALASEKKAGHDAPAKVEHGAPAKAGQAAPSGPEAHWSYSGPEGPSNWGNLSTAYELCKSGTQQSPINIDQTQQAGLSSLETDYGVTPLQVVNNGHTIQVNYAPGSAMKVGHSEYQLLQFHFHSPSENTYSGKPYDMEIHFVHKAASGRLGVLGVFVKQGKHNVALQEIWNHLPKQANTTENYKDVVVNGRDLLPKSREYYRFVGSLTTPPCTEGVQWHMMKEPIEASREQIKAFLDIIGENARPVQKLGHRLLIESAYSGGSAPSGGSAH